MLAVEAQGAGADGFDIHTPLAAKETDLDEIGFGLPAADGGVDVEVVLVEEGVGTEYPSLGVVIQAALDGLMAKGVFADGGDIGSEVRGGHGASLPK
jgi:hypothetical protein